jgi:V8-like Glu-specific endopeptidase
MNAEIMNESEIIARGERTLAQAMRVIPISAPSNYPDANMTMRLSYGTVGGYSPRDGVYYDFFTTARGILEKSKQNAGRPEYRLQPALAELLADRNSYDKYSAEDGDMRVCFVTDNDITGGNSGSAIFNGRGELMGLAFDGNSDDMSVDVIYNGRMQRCIGVDIRYVLFIIEKYGHAGSIIDELMLCH